MLERGKMERGVIELVDRESVVPEGHLLAEANRLFGNILEQLSKIK